jgi:plasmid stability protein
MTKPVRQYTVRNIPEQVDRALRRRVRETGRSFNQIAVEALAAGAGEPARPRRDLSGIAGSVTAREADEIEDEVRRQRQIDPELWK